ncbi:hypothetical protein I6M76_12475 [Citrobacter cronae]|uniref:hypothetical protein n=1 Tax=Citrobacter cronae TaxID=1748967 RepID=UPI001900B00B|nr:hypothetical protein [Citrobacter cronae]MBJ8363413.1 hypothetical protein [Citrobacter cronae]
MYLPELIVVRNVANWQESFQRTGEKRVKCEALRRAEYCAVIWRKGYRRISGKPGIPGEAQCCGGLIPGGIGCWKEKTPARCSV